MGYGNQLTVRPFLNVLVLMLSLVSASSCANASSVKSITLQDATLASALVFEGVVTARQERTDPASGQPFTYFTFNIISVLKGTYPTPTIELGFMGGARNGLMMQVSDMIMPKVGEQGIYFVEQLNQQQVNPLYGWHQGHYLVITNPGAMADTVVPVNTPPCIYWLEPHWL